MLQVYVSSTFEDLSEYRRGAINTIERHAGFQAKAMERYCVADERPVDLCLADVAQCDLYVGIYAWRYGFIPPTNNPEHKSITELEYRQAESLGIPRLLFLATENPTQWVNPDLADFERMRAFREEVSLVRVAGFFRNPDQLATEVSVGIAAWKDRPDFSRYVTRLITDLHQLPHLPNRIPNLSVDDIVTPRVRFKTPSAEQAAKPEAVAEAAKQPALDLHSVIVRERAWFLVGEGGQGKSTAMHHLAHASAVSWLEAWKQQRATGTPAPEVPIPVLIAALSPRISVREQIWGAFQRGGRYNRDLVESWLTTQPLLILIDGFHDVTVFEELKALLEQSPGIRLIVATRPAVSLARLDWPQAHLELLTQENVRALLQRLLGADRGGNLARTLQMQRCLDPFRRPLFARLLALAAPDLTGDLSPARILHNVIERRFLREWEAPPPTAATELTGDLLAHLGYNMLCRESFALDLDFVRNAACNLARSKNLHADLRFADDMIAALEKHGIMERAENGLEFWHASFRDYFAAVWLKHHGSGWQIYRLSWKESWHEGLALYYGLLGDDVRPRRLKQLLFGTSWAVKLLRIGSSSVASSRLLLVLRALGTTSPVDRPLCTCFFSLLPTEWRWFYLNIPDADAHYGLRNNYGLDQAYFSELLGRLRIPEGFAYLRSVDAEFSAIALGLMQADDAGTIREIVGWLAQEFPNPGHYARHQLIVRRILESTDRRYFDEIAETLRHGPDPSRAITCHNLVSTLSTYGSRKERIDLQFYEDWVDLLVEVSLTELSEFVRRELNTLLRWIDVDNHTFRPSPRATKKLLEHVQSPVLAVRRQALDALRVEGLIGHQDVAWRLLSDEDIAITFHALFFYWCFARKGLPVATLKVLRRLLPEEIRAQVPAVATAIVRNDPDIAIPPRCLVMLALSVQSAPINGCRTYALRSLGVLGYASKVIAEAFEQDPLPLARGIALDTLVELLKHDAAPYVLKALDDVENDVRQRAVIACAFERVPDSLKPLAGPKLFRMLAEPNDPTNGYARMALQKFGYLSQGWLPHLGAPKYLGPDVPMTNPPIDPPPP